MLGQILTCSRPLPAIAPSTIPPMTKPSSFPDRSLCAQRPFAARRATIPLPPHRGPPAPAQGYTLMPTTRDSQSNAAGKRRDTVANPIHVPPHPVRHSRVHTRNAPPSRTRTPNTTYQPDTTTERLGRPYTSIPLPTAAPLQGQSTLPRHRVMFIILPMPTNLVIHREISSIVGTHSPGSHPGASPNFTMSALVLVPRQTINAAYVTPFTHVLMLVLMMLLFLLRIGLTLRFLPSDVTPTLMNFERTPRVTKSNLSSNAFGVLSHRYPFRYAPNLAHSCTYTPQFRRNPLNRHSRS